MEKQAYLDFVSKHTQKILEVERYIWEHPESGFKEWNTSNYFDGCDYGTQKSSSQS